LLEQKDLDENRWNRSFQPTLWLQSAVELAENSYSIYFHQALSTPAMSTDMSQVGGAQLIR
jgi:hypothetical protein